jgi:uncharacterized RDD family membrane protein YckC
VHVFLSPTLCHSTCPLLQKKLIFFFFFWGGFLSSTVVCLLTFVLLTASYIYTHNNSSTKKKIERVNKIIYAADFALPKFHSFFLFCFMFHSRKREKLDTILDGNVVRVVTYSLQSSRPSASDVFYVAFMLRVISFLLLYFFF